MPTCVNCGRMVTARHWFRASGKPRCWDRFWTKAREFELMRHWENGLSDAEIAARMGTTKDAVHIHRKRMRLVRGIEQPQVMTGREVQRRMGLGCSKTVRRWIVNGWLKGRQGKGAGPARMWLVREADLRAFLENPAHWPAWKPERITDAELRRYAESVRAETYLTLGEAAAIFGVESMTVGQWIEKGWLPEIRNGRGNHLVRKSDADRLAPTYVYGEGLKQSA